MNYLFQDTNVAKITNTPLTAFVLTPIRPTMENPPAYELNYLNSVPTIEVIVLLSDFSKSLSLSIIV